MRSSSPIARGASPGCQGQRACRRGADPGEVVDDTGRGGVPVGDSLLDAGDPLRPEAGFGEKRCAQVRVPAEHQRQQGPVHLTVPPLVGVDGDGVGRIGEPPVQRASVRILSSPLSGRAGLGSAVARAGCPGRRCGRRSRRRGSTETTARAGSPEWTRPPPCAGLSRRAGARACPGVAAQSSAGERRAVLVQHLQRCRCSA